VICSNLDAGPGILVPCSRCRSEGTELAVLVGESVIATQSRGGSAPGGSGTLNRSSGFVGGSGVHTGTSRHRRAPIGHGTYSVEWPHQLGMVWVCGRDHPNRRKSSVRNSRMGCSHPQRQQRRVGRRPRSRSNQMGGTMGALDTTGPGFSAVVEADGQAAAAPPPTFSVRWPRPFAGPAMLVLRDAHEGWLPGMVLLRCRSRWWR
jgi:hypothetical protein